LPRPESFRDGVEETEKSGLWPTIFFNVVSALSLGRYTLFKVCVRYRPRPVGLCDDGRKYGKVRQTARVLTETAQAAVMNYRTKAILHRSSEQFTERSPEDRITS